MSLDRTEGKSTLVQLMAWCRQATSHYLSQRWPRSVSPYGVIKPQWVLSHWLLGDMSVIKSMFFNIIIQNNRLDSRCGIALRWMPQNLNNKSTVVQVMAWCHQAPSHYLSVIRHQAFTWTDVDPDLLALVEVKAWSLVPLGNKPLREWCSLRSILPVPYAVIRQERVNSTLHTALLYSERPQKGWIQISESCWEMVRGL